VVEPEKAAGLVPLDDTQKSKLSARVDGFIRELISLELAPRVVRLGGEALEDRQTTGVVLTCEADRAQIVVRDPARPNQALELDLSTIAAPARARLIALSLAELLATADMEPAANVPEIPEPAPPRPRPRDSSMWLAAGIVREGEPRLLAPSLQTGLVLNVAGLPLAAVMALDAQRGARDVPAGRVTLWTVSGSAGPATQLHAGPLELGLGAGVRLGYARMIGDADETQAAVSGHTVSGLWWGPTLGASASWRVRAAWGIRAGVDLSWIARAVRGTDSGSAAVLALDGLLVQATLGLSLSLPALRVGHQEPL
jgi:hypothetical protein